VDQERLFKDVADPHPGIERRVGILKDHLHPAPDGKQRPAIRRQ